MQSAEKYHSLAIPSEIIEDRILLIRGQKVMIDHDLAILYAVTTRHLKRQVRRNIARFPEDFMFRLTKNEKSGLVPNWHRFETLKHSTSLPMAFTEHGILMLSSVLKSKTAIQVNIQIMRVFNKLREMLASHKDLRKKIEEMESRYDHQFKVVFDAIKEFIELNRQPVPEEQPKKKYGFETGT
jgi:hypothetical protein